MRRLDLLTEGRLFLEKRMIAFHDEMEKVCKDTTAEICKYLNQNKKEIEKMI